MNGRFLLIVFFYCVGLQASMAQKAVKCGTQSYEKLMEQKFPAYKSNKNYLEKKVKENKNFRIAQNGVYHIPVVVHVIYYNTLSNIDDQKIYDQINILNQDYRRTNQDAIKTPPEFRPVAADCNIEFCLATRDPNGNVTTGIVRKKTSRANFSGFSDAEDDAYLKSLSYWPSNQYLNIWVTTLTNDVIGYSWYPETPAIPDLDQQQRDSLDGVVIQYTSFGNNESSTSKYNKGRTTTHEVGHWLGLRHIFGEHHCGDDFIADTPVQDGNNISLTRNGDCTHYSNCGNTPTLDMSANYMDYSPDNCMNLFTSGQAERMQTVMESSSNRKQIQDSPGCCNPQNVTSLPFYESFEENDVLSVNGWSTSSTLGKWSVTDAGGFNNSNNSAAMRKENNATFGFDYLLSIPLDFTVIKNPKIDFSIAASGTDSLVIGYISNCLDTIKLRTIYRDELGNNNFQSTRPPLEAWKNFSVDLTVLGLKKIANIIFINYGKGKGSIHVDDINIYNAQSNFSIKIYPNPAQEFINVEIGYKEPIVLIFTIYNSLGMLVSTWNDKSLGFKKGISTAGLVPGMYFLQTSVQSNSFVRKILIEK